MRRHRDLSSTRLSQTMIADWPSTDRHMYRQEDTSTHYPCTYFSHSTLIFEVEEALQ